MTTVTAQALQKLG